LRLHCGAECGECRPPRHIGPSPSASALIACRRQCAEQGFQCGGAIGLDRYRCRQAAKLFAVYVDANQVSREDEAAIAVAVIIGRSEFGPDRNHQIGVVNQRAHCLQAGARVYGKGVTVHQASPIGSGHYRRINGFRETGEHGSCSFRTAASQYQRTLCPGDQSCGLGNRARLRGGGHSSLEVRDQPCSRLDHHVGRYLDMHRAGAR
jgi:hypothetical protein